jgi:hypothetical protein
VRVNFGYMYGSYNVTCLWFMHVGASRDRDTTICYLNLKADLMS